MKGGKMENARESLRPEAVKPRVVTRRQAREANVASDVAVPLMQALIAAVVVAALIRLWGASWRMTFLAFCLLFVILFVVIGFLQWVQRWEMESEEHFEPPVTRVVEVNKGYLPVYGNTENQLARVRRQQTMSQLDQFIRDCRTYGTTTPALTACPSRWSRQDVERLRGELIRMNLAYWENQRSWKLAEEKSEKV